jgi:hypothetical protein
MDMDIPAQSTSLDSLETGQIQNSADEQYVRQILSEMNQLPVSSHDASAQAAPPPAAQPPPLAVNSAPLPPPPAPAPMAFDGRGDAAAAAAAATFPPAAGRREDGWGAWEAGAPGKGSAAPAQPSFGTRVLRALFGPLLAAALVLVLALPVVPALVVMALPASIAGNTVLLAVAVACARAAAAGLAFAGAQAAAHAWMGL